MRTVLKRMKNAQVVSPDDIFVEVWRYLGER